jgi:dipeptidyl aminopeptidase/acylaminoacyl peptidase
MFRFHAHVSAALTLSAALASSASAQQTHPYAFTDWADTRTAGPVAMAPDGNMILYRVGWGDTVGTGHHEWRTVQRSGSASLILHLPEGFSPAGFTADGAGLYGTLTVKDVAQLATVGLAGGKATPLTDLPRGIGSATISPDGTRYVVQADPRAPDPLAGVRTVAENPETRLYVVGADGSGGAWWCPDLQDVDAVAWSPDGRELAVLSSLFLRKIGHHEMRSSLDVCGPNGSRHVADIPNATSGIAWTDGGKTLAFLTTTTHVLTPDHVWTVPAAGGQPVDDTPDLDGSAVSLRGDVHGTVWVAVARGVHTEVDTLAMDGGRFTLAPAYRWAEGVVGLPVSPQLDSAPAGASAQVLPVADPTHAPNLAVDDGGSLRKITHEGDDALAGVALGKVQDVHWTSKDGTALEGIVTFPAGYVEGRKYPFLVLPHGGPESNDQLALDAFARIIAGLGYVVMQPEYRGSTGHGSAFLDAIYQHFGDRAYDDVNSATDYAVAQGWADPDRLAIFGWSAGGFMTAWTVTRTDRYKAAIEGAGITDWLSFIPTSDIAQTDYDARMPEHDAQPFLAFSAVAYADRVTTPLLILHGAADVRVPTFQGRELFMLLAELGKTVRMVTYPGSPHFPVRWEQRRDVFREVAAWLQKYNP